MRVRARNILKVYWNEARHYPFYIIAMVLSLVVTGVCALEIPIFYKHFFDTITKAQPSAVLATELFHTILGVLIISSISWVGYRAATFLNNYFQPKVMSDLANHAFDYLIEHSYSFFTNNFGGSLTRRVRRLSSAFEDFADRVYWNLYPLAFRIVGVTIVLWFTNRTIALVFLGWAILFMIINYFFAVWKLKYDEETTARDTEVTAVLADAITNHSNIQVFTGFHFETDAFKKVSEKLRRLMTFTWSLSTIMESVQAALIIFVEFAIFVLAIRAWQKGELSVGTFVLIQAYLIGLVNDLWDFGRHIRAIYRSFADAAEMVEIMNTPHEIRDLARAKPLVVSGGKIEFRKVTFSFHQTRKVLDNLSVIIKPGEKVALVGPSGAGKSTITKVLLRFYDIDGGSIFIDDQNISKITQESLRESLSYVPQESVLFHRTIRENIRYGRRTATDEEVDRASKLAHCDEFINDLPKGYDTYVGERGIKLSGGERQRVAIARAILKDAPILILDEATSSLDSESEHLIQDALSKLMEGRTTIVIAHRLSTIRSMDRILVVAHGKIVEEGSHDALLKKPKSIYKKLWKIQSGGFLKDVE